MEDDKKIVKVETYYMDDNNNFVEPEKATKGVIRELDADGNLVRETWGTFSPMPEIPEDDDEFDKYLASLEKKK